MNKAELIETLATRSGMQKQKAKKMLNAYVDIVTEAMQRNEDVILVGFGTLTPHDWSMLKAKPCRHLVY